MKVIDLKNSAEPKRISANCRALSEETGREFNGEGNVLRHVG